MPKLSGFADEISKDLEEQIAALKDMEMNYFDLRQVWGKNVLDLTDDECKKIKERIDREGIKIAAIGSPIGKSTIDKPEEFELERLKRAVELAEFFGCKYIRVFSFYPPEGEDIATYRDEVIRRMKGWIDYLVRERKDIILTHENEARIYGSIPERCVDLMENLYCEKMVQCFDPANFVVEGETDIFNTCWLPLKKYVGYMHLKDCMADRKTMVPCGEGAGDVDKILPDAYKNGYDGFFTLEPHLRLAETSFGFTGADLFKKAVDAVRTICKKNNIPLS